MIAASPSPYWTKRRSPSGPALPRAGEAARLEAEAVRQHARGKAPRKAGAINQQPTRRELSRVKSMKETRSKKQEVRVTGLWGYYGTVQ